MIAKSLKIIMLSGLNLTTSRAMFMLWSVAFAVLAVCLTTFLLPTSPHWSIPGPGSQLHNQLQFHSQHPHPATSPQPASSLPTTPGLKASTEPPSVKASTLPTHRNRTSIPNSNSSNQQRSSTGWVGGRRRVRGKGPGRRLAGRVVRGLGWPGPEAGWEWVGWESGR